MGFHPVNLAIRFLLEIFSLISLGMWGWNHGEGLVRYVLAIGIPAGVAVIWGVFAVPGDPSRSGSTPVVTPGWVRLLLELVVFTAATLALYDIGYVTISLILGITAFLHYVFSYDRIRWLISH